ncbi:MAG: hypothetical protein V2I82_06870 [Halieaceae bacterium]|jgi:hypothetical protein|nr:hypothetical protein [Halieaceae bacterium]
MKPDARAAPGADRLPGTAAEPCLTILLAFCCCVLLLSSSLALSQGCSEASSEEGTADLDHLLELNDYVFLARVDRVERLGVLAGEDETEEAHLFVYQPSLKGAVPPTLRFDRSEPCAVEFSEGAVYLMFLNDLESTPYRSEARLVLASERGPAVAWILDWIEGKRP